MVRRTTLYSSVALRSSMYPSNQAPVAIDPPAPSRALMLLETRALPELGAFFLMQPWLAMTPVGDGHPVLVLPGLLADDRSTRPLRSFLNSHGYRAHGWKQGRNLGLRGSLESDMVARIDELF